MEIFILIAKLYLVILMIILTIYAIRHYFLQSIGFLENKNYIIKIS